jgi:hypothetical protein
MLVENVYLVTVKPVGDEVDYRPFVVINAADGFTAEDAVEGLLSDSEEIVQTTRIQSSVAIIPGFTTLVDLAGKAQPTRDKVAAVLGVDPASLSGSLSFTTTTTLQF